MKNQRLSSVIIEPTEPASASVIWLHGLGADGHDFEPVVPQLQLSPLFSVRFIFPHAPIRPVTINGGMEMRAWYDILSFDIPREVDQKAIEQSSAQIVDLLEEEQNAGIASEKIFLAGFSQGGAIALHTAIRYAKPLAGILALSTYLPTIETIFQQSSTANQKTPFLMGHGTQDPVVPIAYGKSAYEALLEHGYSATWTEYTMPHSVCYTEIVDISRWMKRILSP